VDALPIIVALDIAEQIPPRLLSGGPAALMNQLHLQRMEERLHRGIVIAAARPAHRWLGLDEGQVPGIGLGRILAAADALLFVKR
jgi:hypothetical protein